MISILRITIYIIVLGLSFDLYAQKEIYNWCFTESNTIKFSDSLAPVFGKDAKIQTMEGSSSISDSNGNLLFYSDGITVWNKKHEIMEGGFDLNGGFSSTQSCIILKQPESDSIYYIFTVDQLIGANGLCYSIVDMSLNNGLGKLIVKNSFLYAPSTEKLHATLHKNQKDIWILTHEYGNSIFRANLLTKYGLNESPVISDVGQDIDIIPAFSVGYLKFSPSGNKVAVAKCAYFPTLEIFDFDNCTGKLSNQIMIDFKLLNGTNGDFFAYGLEYSPDEKYLYVGSASTVYQFDLKYKTPNELISNSVNLLRNLDPDSRLMGALQMGPDQKIYMIYSRGILGTEYLGVISKPNKYGDSCEIDIKKHYSLNLLNYGLPNFMSNYYRFKPYFTSQNLCFNDTSSFNLKNIDADSIKAIKWFYKSEDNTLEKEFSSQKTPFFKFSEPGEYNIRVEITTINGNIVELFDNISIVRPRLFATSDTVICSGKNINIDLRAKGRCDSNHSWKSINGDIIFDTIYTINKAGNYYFKVQAIECEIVDSLKVKIISQKPIFSLGKDTSICKLKANTLTLKVDFQDNTKFLWQDNSINNSIDVTGSGRFYVKCTNACGSKSDTIYVKFDDELNLDIGSSFEICKSESVTLNASSKSNFYKWNTGEKDSIIEVTNSGLYIVEVGNSCGNMSDSANVKVVNSNEILVPNIITPNNDQLNDFFIVNKYLQGASFDVYNRWGNNVYSCKNYSNNWNGTDLSEGVYFYEFSNTCFKETLKGWVQIVR